MMLNVNMMFNENTNLGKLFVDIYKMNNNIIKKFINFFWPNVILNVNTCKLKYLLQGNKYFLILVTQTIRKRQYIDSIWKQAV